MEEIGPVESSKRGLEPGNRNRNWKDQGKSEIAVLDWRRGINDWAGIRYLQLSISESKLVNKSQ